MSLVSDFIGGRYFCLQHIRHCCIDICPRCANAKVAFAAFMLAKHVFRVIYYVTLELPYKMFCVPQSVLRDSLPV